MGKKQVYIGQLDRRVEIVYDDKTVKKDDGSPNPNEVPVATVWAALEDESGQEVIDGQIVAVNTRFYVLRWRSELVAADGTKHLIKDSDGRYMVLHVETLGRKEFLKLKTQRYGTE